MPRGFNFWFTSQLVYYISWNYTSHSFLNQDVINDYVSGTGTKVLEQMLCFAWLSKLAH